MAWVSLFVDILTDRSGRLSAACSVVCLAPPRLGVLGEMGMVFGGFLVGMGVYPVVCPASILCASPIDGLIGIGLLDAPPFVGEGG